LVVEAEKTFQSMVLESVNKLSACDVVLLVFNKTLISLSDGYYYGYGYGQYATNSYTSGPGGSAGPNNSGS